MIKVLFLILLSSNLADYNEAASVFSDPDIDPLSDEMINAINSLNTTWKAKKNFLGFSLENFKRQHYYKPDGVKLPIKDIPIADDIPTQFDAREKWPHCASISYIRDQGDCGSCWAFGAVEAMSDRICIHSGGKIQVDLSAIDVVACAKDRVYSSGDNGKMGCDGGFTDEAWKYWNNTGVVTGGYQGKGCKPYPYPPCNHYKGQTLRNCTDKAEPPPDCKPECKPGYRKSYQNDTYRGIDVYGIDNDEQKIQTEIMTNGPVEATFKMYSDFFAYRSGVYQKKKGRYLINHSVRILGWGVENKNEYWLVANSWGSYWGDQGYVKFSRRDKNCKIEKRIKAGLPMLKL